MPRSDKGVNRSVWVDMPCSAAGCPNRVLRRRSEMRDHNFCSRTCYADWVRDALRRLAVYERLYGPLPKGHDPT